MRYIILLLALLFAGAVYFFPDFAKSTSSLFILNSDNRGVLPRNFRLTPLQTSASAQFTEDELQRMLEVIPAKRMIMVDLREEPHGFLNGDAVSWYGNNNWVNEGKSKEEIEKDERERLNALSHQFIAIVYKNHKKSNHPAPYLVKEVTSEEALAKKYGFEYLRLPVRDHVKPSDAAVDTFIARVKVLKKEDWLHFHCSAGKARSTTFLAMYDMMQNASDTSIDDIIARQQFYGGINLFSDPEEDQWKYTHLVERVEFLKKFYRYCRENPEFTLPWSAWSKNQESTVENNP